MQLAWDDNAVFAHQHRRLASFVSGSSQLDHFLGAADAAGLVSSVVSLLERKEVTEDRNLLRGVEVSAV